MAEIVCRDMLKKRGLDGECLVASSATSTEEIWNGVGNPVYPPAREELMRHGLSCDGKRAVQVTREDYARYDLFVCMDDNNVRNLLRILGGDPQKKVCKLLDYTPEGGDVIDPWYYGNFDATYRDVVRGCEALLAQELHK